jgi:hypothetical protein
MEINRKSNHAPNKPLTLNHLLINTEHEMGYPAFLNPVLLHKYRFME